MRPIGIIIDAFITVGKDSPTEQGQQQKSAAAVAAAADARPRFASQSYPDCKKALEPACDRAVEVTPTKFPSSAFNPGFMKV